MKRFLVVGVVAIAAALTVPSLAAAAPPTPASAATFSGPVTSANGATTATAVIRHVSVVNGQLVADQYTATAYDASGNVVATLSTATDPTLPALPLGSNRGSRCSILHLDLAPISLDLLGLELTTSRIVIDLTAVSGPGNLLGNLLCAVTGLLDNTGGGGGGGGLLGGLQTLLDNINALLAGLLGGL